MRWRLGQLVDIAERALSPAVNDPTTAVQSVDQLHDLLPRLATRALRPRQSFTDNGRVAVDVTQPDFADCLTLAADEVARWGSGSDRILRRLAVMIADLRAAARPEHRLALERVVADLGLPSSPLDEQPLAPSDSGLR